MRLSAILFVALALAVTLVAVPQSAHAEGWFSELAGPADVTIGDLLANPEDFTEREIRVKVVWRGEGEFWNPYYTRFDQAAYANFTAWPWNARLFEKRDYTTFYPLFYATKGEDGGRLCRKLRDLEPLTGIEIEGEVQDVWHGKPSIEIKDFRVISGQMDQDEVQSAARGDMYYAAGRFAEAEEAYDDAISSRLDDWLKAELYRRRGDAQFRQGNYGDARRSYDYALDNAEDNDILRTAYNAADARYEAQREGGQAGDAPPARFVPTFGDGSNDVDLVIAAFRGEAPQEQAAAEATPPAQPKPAPKPTPKAAPKPAPKVAPKPEPKPEPKATEEPAPQPEAVPEEVVEEPMDEPAPEPTVEPMEPEDSAVVPTVEPTPAPEPVPAPAAVDVGKLPLLPFFGCENVTQDQFRSLLVDIRSNPEVLE